VQYAQVARWASDFVSGTFFSTRFSTELLKTFTRRSQLNSFLVAYWFANCIAANLFFARLPWLFDFSPAVSFRTAFNATQKMFSACYDLILLIA